MLTQKFLAQMLGVRRTSVTEVASKIQAAGPISHSRGAIKIIDLETLMALSCECYETMRETDVIDLRLRGWTAEHGVRGDT